MSQIAEDLEWGINCPAMSTHAGGMSLLITPETGTVQDAVDNILKGRQCMEASGRLLMLMQHGGPEGCFDRQKGRVDLAMIHAKAPVRTPSCCCSCFLYMTLTFSLMP